MKNWLIRTKSFHLLGPVSQEKVRELIDNGSITGEDEICSGNGYWFSVKEADLVARYIYQNNPQSFNLVSEALNEKIQRDHVITDQRFEQVPNYEIKDDVTVVVSQTEIAGAVSAQEAPQVSEVKTEKLVQDREKTTEFYLPAKEPTIITKLSALQEAEKKEIPKREITKTDMKLNSSGLIKVPKAVAVHRKTVFYKFLIVLIVAIVAIIALNRIVIFDFLINSSHADVIEDNLKKKTQLL